MRYYLAQAEHPVGNITGGGVALNSTDPVTTLADVISTVIGLLTVIGALYFMFMIITGAIGIISSGGDKGKYEDARNKITTGAIGFVVVVAAMFVVGLVGIILDIPILDLGEMVNRIQMP